MKFHRFGFIMKLLFANNEIKNEKNKEILV